MLDRFAPVLRRDFSVEAGTARDLVAAIGAIATAGPAGEDPHIVLGGTGVLPVRDTEDRGVLETAIAGEAQLLATANLGDFKVGRPVSGGGRLCALPGGQALLIAHPDGIADVLRKGGQDVADLLRRGL